MKNILYKRNQLRYDVQITVSLLREGETLTKNENGSVFTLQEMMDEKGNRFYNIETSPFFAWTHWGPLILLVNKYFHLDLMECIVHREDTGESCKMAVDRKAIDLPALFTYSAQGPEPGIYLEDSLCKKAAGNPTLWKALETF